MVIKFTVFDFEKNCVFNIQDLVCYKQEIMLVYFESNNFVKLVKVCSSKTLFLEK